MDTALIIKIVVLIIMIIGSGFFSSAETALTTFNLIQAQLLADEGNKSAKRIVWIRENSSKMLSAILIGNNVVNITASALTTTLTIDILGNAYIGLATGLLTLIILITGEILPKSMATTYSLKLSLVYSGIIVFLMKVLTPVIFIIEKIRMGVLKLFGIDGSSVSSMTEDELKSLVDVGLETGAIEDDEFEMITNVFSLDDTLAKDIMIPRNDMVFVPLDASLEELLAIYREVKYTRYPVYNENRDTVIGTINIKDVLTLSDDEEFHIGKIMREPHFTFEHKEVGTLLIEMRQEAINFITVLDEYGATSGLITLEDILEEIVGEIRDEYDKDERDAITQLKGDGEYLVDGSTNIDDVNDELETSFSSEEYDSSGGYLIEQLDRLPKSGEEFVLEDGTKFIAEVVKRNRVEKVHIFLPLNEKDSNDGE